ncbi:protein-L-isoaspartate O-methyltransferase [Sphingomonas lacunae]|uniref:Protein-L-isoaspartate O-methyltransferase n=1 Tax=Sphingomonas lacunae TaxID=2698828 RepID=A0A6M4ARV4_9SPHN|nr:protein-L-isoaspartate O-methyltransferase [Sphingomonas lacunae]QJQ31785.1 protein-L-isoaspartate O-methyltransferase [Sphingomonas lacunae]
MTAASVQAVSTDSTALRRAMVDSQLRTNEVNSPALIAAIVATPREAHAPETSRAGAYSDRALPLGGGRSLNPALTTARLIAELGNVTGRSVLLIGAATGYAAAILARLGARVTAVEESKALMDMARTALAGMAGVTLVEGQLSAGAPDLAPFDALIIDGAIEQLPAALLGQLAEGAPIVTGMNDGGVTRLGRAIYASASPSIRPLSFIDLECVRLPGFAPPERFSF